VIISARPYPYIAALFSSGDYFDLTCYEFHQLGRESLLYSLIKLGLKVGDRIIIPAYMCDSTIKPLSSYGFNLVFIDIDENLSLPVDKLKKIISNKQIKALLLVHYFGLTQEVDEIIGLCREYGVKVVEDASHGFMSQLLRDKKSVKGDAEIFSMRKSLPVVDGGALRIYNGSYDVTKKNNKCVSIISDTKYLILRLLEKVVTGFGINIYGQFISNIKTKFRSRVNNENCRPNIEPCEISWQLSKYLGNEEYIKSTQHKIVHNFNQLNQALQRIGFRLFVESVKGNVVPQVCVIYDNNGGLVDYLRSKGIGAWRWPGVEMPEQVVHNSSQYPNAVFFDKKLVLIPIHQSIDDKQINYMIQILSRWQL
jgi:perosamine synthetase